MAVPHFPTEPVQNNVIVDVSKVIEISRNTIMDVPHSSWLNYMPSTSMTKSISN